MEPSDAPNSFVNRGKCDGATGPPSREVLRMAEQTGQAYARPGGGAEQRGGAYQGSRQGSRQDGRQRGHTVGHDGDLDEPAGQPADPDRPSPVGQVVSADQADGRRGELIEAARERWIAALTDLGGRNTLLYYKDRRAGTLDLAAADPEALEKFCRTGSIRLTKLFHDVDVRADAIRRVQAIYRKARELLEERGIRAAYLATGLARWDELF